jgi:TetR/AcrR family transcriptional regulator, cholesterol catabolism regulator
MSELTRYDQKLEHILRTSARIFAEKSYHSTSMRDISRATGVSLAGLYHYCKSKEELLFLIQDHCFGRVLDRLNKRLRGEKVPEQKLRILIENHLAFFAANMAEMKVVSHEADSLSGELRVHVSGKKERYTRTARKILSDIRQTHARESTIDLTVATYSLFGMMNWIYNWYNPHGKINVSDLADNLIELFLGGFLSGSANNARKPQATRQADPANIWLGARRRTSVLLLLLGLLIWCPAKAVRAQQPTPPSTKVNPTLPPAIDPERIDLLPERRKMRPMCFGDPVYGGNIRFEAVPEEPRIGGKAVGYPKSVNKQPAPKNMLSVFLVTYKEVEYTVFVDSEQIIKQIKTTDPKFKTAEGVAIGDAAEKAIAASKSRAINHGDCAYAFILPSGWEVYFGAESVLSDGTLAPGSKVVQLVIRAPRN